MNPKAIIKIISVLIIIIAIFMMIPAGIALYENDIKSFKSFLYPISGIFILSAIVLFFLRNMKISSLSTRDGFLFVAMSWFSASIIGALPFYLSQSVPTFADAFFETISGFSTTGASVIPNVEILSDSILFWRSLTHWLGGMGIVVLTVAILPLLGIGGLKLIEAEAPGPTVDKLTPRITETAKILWGLYVGMTVIETILLLLGGMSFFDSLTHTFGTVATGGFSTKNSSTAYFNSAYIEWVITIFMILAGTNFTMFYRILTGKFASVFKDTEVRVYLFIIVSFSLIITLNLFLKNVYSFSDSLRYSFFQSATIITTTGFASADYEKWPAISQTLLFLLMFVGGCSGSTGGGIKVIRIATLFKMAFNEMKYLLHPRGIFILKVNRNIIKKEIAYSISGFFFSYIIIVLIITLVVSTAEYDLLSSLTTALATLGNIGPGFGVIGPTENFSHFPIYVKWVLSAAMLIGRLEIYTVLVIFTPIFWKR